MRDITVDAAGPDALGRRSSRAIDAVDGARVVDTTDRTFLLHVGGKIEQHNKHAAEDARRPLDGLHARASRASARRSPRTPTRPSSTRSSATRSPSSPTAPRCSASATSARAAAMPVMEGKAMLFKEFAGVDAFPICLDTKDPDEIVDDGQGDRARRSAASTSRTSPRRAASRSRTALKARARHPGLPRRPARHRGRRARRAAQRLQARPAAARGPARAGHRPRRRRRRGDEDPARGRRARRHRLRLARRAVAPSARTTSTAR